ncbi:hypothetical protein LUZ60_006761 [Juncus effusus]|nr:hypothetical protein LUZ60_006761 [Juncus effusus]
MSELQLGATKPFQPWRQAPPFNPQTGLKSVNFTSTHKWRKNWTCSVNRKRLVATAQLVTYSSRISTDLPLYEPPGVSFDEYLHDRPRIFSAMFPDQHRSKRLNEEEWRIQMLPLQFLLLTVYPVVVMQIKCTSNGNNYPNSVPKHITSLLELHVTEWELQGLESAYKPTDFSLRVKGLLYPKRGGVLCSLKGDLEISISCILPPALALIPDNILRPVAESVLRGLAERMKRDVDVGVLADFRKFRREKLMNKSAHSGIVATTRE